MHHLLRRTTLPFGVMIVLLSLLATPLCFGQGGFGTILGTVTDASAASIPGAQVVAVSDETGTRFQAVTNEYGSYQVLQLRPGIYTIEVEAEGFKKVQRSNIEVRVADRLTLDFTLDLGAITETVTVTSEAPQLRTSDAQTGEVVDNIMIQNLPQLQRDPLQLLILAGNVAGSGNRAAPGSDTRINGGRTIGIEYKVDGVTAGTGLGHKVVDTTPTMETVAEFKVITNGISAEYGRLSGGAVEVVTKSGTNDYHGQLFEYFQNDHLNANSWQQNALGGEKVKFTQNLFGGVVGGPVLIPKVYNGKNRTFFFFNYEGLRRREGGRLQEANVPTEKERQGDFSETFFQGIRPVLYDQNGTVIFDESSNQYIRQDLLGDGSRIPQSRLSPVSLALLEFTPLPNQSPSPGTSSFANYVAPQDSRSERDVFGTRLDHNFSDAHRFFGRFTYRNSESGQTRWRGPASRANQNRSKEAFNVTLNYDWMISPTLLFNARAGMNHWPTSSGGLLAPGFSSANVPFDPITRSLLGTDNVPLVRTAGTFFITENATQNIRNYTTYDGGFAFTKMTGRHTLKFGFQHTRYFDNFSSAGGGTFSFLASPVHQIAGVDFGFGSDISKAYGMAAFMVGVNNQAGVNGFTTRANNFNYYAAYVQDDFRVNTKLTLNLGLRWDMESPITERFDKLYFWDPSASAPFSINPGYDYQAEVIKAGLDPAKVATPAWVSSGLPTGAIRIANTPEFPDRKGSYYHWKHFAPRIGAAYQLDNKTVLRASFAMMYLPTTGSENAYSGSGLSLSDSANAGWHASDDNLVHLISNWESPFKPENVTPYERTTQKANWDATSPTSPAGYNREVDMPKEYAWSFGIQRQLPARFLVEATYNGNAGRDLIAASQVGRFPRDLFTGGPAGDNSSIYTTQIASPTAGQTQNNSVVGEKQNLAILQYQYPYFGLINVGGTNIGRSNYHALNIRIEKRFSAGLSGLFNYTLSKALDDVGGTNTADVGGATGNNLGGKRTQSVDNVTDVYGISPLDETHVVRFAFNYLIPVGRGRSALSSPQTTGAKILDHVVGGWEIAGLGFYRSGRPVTLVATTPNINNNIRVEWTYGNFVDPSNPTVDNPAFTNNDNVFYSSRDALPASPERRFFNAADADKFTYGNLPPIFPRLRNPSSWGTDVSLMKSFYFTPDNRYYLQFRMEGRNFFNIRGFGNYNTTIGTKYFGMITSAGQDPRTIQMSLRFVF